MASGSWTSGFKGLVLTSNVIRSGDRVGSIRGNRYRNHKKPFITKKKTHSKKKKKEKKKRKDISPSLPNTSSLLVIKTL